WYHRVWLPALKAAGIPNFRFHDLRHTTATRLGEQGVRTRDIASALGHADEQMAQRYDHASAGHGDMLGVMQKLVRAVPATATEPQTEPSALAADTPTADGRAASA